MSDYNYAASGWQRSWTDKAGLQLGQKRKAPLGRPSIKLPF
jgi:hypothetical protein